MSRYISFYTISIFSLNTVLVSKSKRALNDHKIIFEQLTNERLRVKRRRTEKQKFAWKLLFLKKFYNVVYISKNMKIQPYILLNVKQNGIYSKQSAILNHVLSKINVKVKSIIQLKDSESVLINKNIKLTFIRVPYYNFYTFKLSAPHQYINRLYS